MLGHCIWLHHVCAHTWLGPHDWAQTWLCPDTIVPRHDCDQTWLCPETIVPRHDCAQTRLSPRHDCAQTRLCPDTSVPRHISAPTRIIVVRYDHVLGQYNIIIVFTRLIMWQLDWWKHKHAQLLLAKRSVIIQLVFSNHQQYSSWNISLFYYSMSACQGTKYVSGHKRTCFCPDTIVTTRL